MVIKLNENEEKQEQTPGAELGTGAYFLRKFVRWIHQKLKSKKPQG
jgi:hypothetical protein